MTNNKFDEIIANDKHLNALLKEKKVSAFSQFRNKDFRDESFKEYISNDYNTIFLELFSNSTYENTDVRTALLRSIEFLATDSFKETLMARFSADLENSYAKLMKFKEFLQATETKSLSLENAYEKNNVDDLDLDSIFSPENFFIYNNYGNHPKIVDVKNKIMNECLAICDEISKSKPNKDHFRYAVYNVLFNNLEKITTLDANQLEKLNLHNKTISKKRNAIEYKYFIMVTLIVLFFVLRLLKRVS
ncbi:MAG: hypothetical protein Q8K02_16795 [Flavobacterium sp.]|nr:hypothetical protein [Flavobacterium sp.]